MIITNPHNTATNALNDVARGGSTLQVAPFLPASWPPFSILPLTLVMIKLIGLSLWARDLHHLCVETVHSKAHASPWGAALGFRHIQFRSSGICRPTAWDVPSVVSWSLLAGDTKPVSGVNLTCWVPWKSIHTNAGKDTKLLESRCPRNILTIEGI